MAADDPRDAAEAPDDEAMGAPAEAELQVEEARTADADGGSASEQADAQEGLAELAEAAAAEPAGDGTDAAEPEGAETATPALPNEQLDAVVEALLFAAGEALTAQRIAQAVGESSPRRVKSAIERLRRQYHAQGRSFDVLEMAGGHRLYSRPEFQPWIARLDKARAPEKLTAAALETLAIIAYRQPIVRADVDAIRGVQSSALMKSLMERKLIRAVGRSDRPGRPMQYGTTRRFLDHFGLGTVKDLPRVEDLKSP